MQPHIEDYNSLVTDYMATFTSSTRFPSDNINDFRKILTSAVPFPRHHFMTPTMANLGLRCE